jgi:glycosyltransferase involved in cell wall biosynthesis
VRIVYLSPLGILGGAERSLLDVMASVRQVIPSAELTLIVATEGPLLAHARKLGVRVVLLPMPPEMVGMGDSQLRGPNRMQSVLAGLCGGTAAALATRRYADRLRRTILTLQPAVIHSNGNKFHLLTRLVGLNAIPVVWHLRDFLTAHPLMVHALRWASARASEVLAISRAVGRDARAVLPHTPLRVIYNAIDTDFFSPGPGAGPMLDQLAGLPPTEPGTVRIGLVAAFARWKGQDIFLDAAARMIHSRTGQNPRFYLVGGPIYRTHDSQFSEPELRAQAAALHSAAHVGFIGFQEDIVAIYRALDIVVHASTQPEPFGRTIVEAMACARPVIVSRTGGAMELFTESCDAVGVRPGDAQALAAAIGMLVDDPHRRLRMSQCARQTAVDKFSRARLGREVAAVYARVTERATMF